MSNIFNISPRFDFLSVACDYIIKTATENNLNFANDIILLPTRRSVRRMKDLFFQKSIGGVVLLPKILPLGDVEDGVDVLEFADDLPFDKQVISDVERVMLISNLIAAKNKDFNFSQSFFLAGSLIHLMDMVEMEELSFDALDGIVPQRYSLYWQETLEFLKIIAEFYPRMLDDYNLVNPVSKKVRLIEKQVEVWKNNTGIGRIFILGSTGSLVPVSNLICRVAKLDKGFVFLCGIDRFMSEVEFLNVGQNHPQYGFKNILIKMKKLRDDVVEIKDNLNENTMLNRERLASSIMVPSDGIASWRGLSFEKDVLSGIVRCDFKNDIEEVLGISLIVREALEKKQKCLIITPDRKIAKAVAGELLRWDIHIDDSAGVMVSETDVGNFIMLIINAIHERFSPYQLLAILRHKYVHLGYSKDKLEMLVNWLEKSVLRGEFGLNSIFKITSKIELLKMSGVVDVMLIEVEQLLIKVLNLTDNLMKKFGNEDLKYPMSQYIKEHIEIVHSFVENDEKNPGFVNNILYGGDINSQISDVIRKLILSLDNSSIDETIFDINAKSYLDFISNYFLNTTLREGGNLNNDIRILNSIEARLMVADVYIVAGLNEGVFPAISGEDPWLNRSMRGEFGLPFPERKVGLSSLDFYSFFCKKNIFLTRAKKVDGKNTIASRWLQKFDAILDIMKMKLDDEYYNTLCHWISGIDLKGEGVRYGRPAPVPPIDARPTKLFVSWIERWYRDPYSIFAAKILNLKKLEDVDIEVSPADFGNIVHNSFDEFKRLEVRTLAVLMDIIKRNCLPYNDLDIIDFWFQKFKVIAEWFISYEKNVASIVKKSFMEVEGNIKISERFNLCARADRVDILHDNTAWVVDYKTGYVPTKKDVFGGFAPQLVLEAVILQQGGFKDIGSVIPSELRYIALKKGEGGKIISYDNDKGELDQLLNDSFEKLKRVVMAFEVSGTPYINRPNPSKFNDKMDEYDDFKHLARVDEWFT